MQLIPLNLFNLTNRDSVRKRGREEYITELKGVKPLNLMVLIAVVTLHTFALGKLDLLTVLPRET